MKASCPTTYSFLQALEKRLRSAAPDQFLQRLWSDDRFT